MNVNHEHKVIWFAPQKCGTKALAHIFGKLGFKFYDNLDLYRKNITINYQSHEIEVPSELSDYKILISTRNPYDRVLSLYQNFTMVGMESTYTIDLQIEYMNKFENFVKELFNLGDNQDEKVILTNYLLRYSYKTEMDYDIIRMENIIEDLSKINFVVESDIWNSGYVHDFIITNKYITNRPAKYNKVYTKTAAKLVYENQYRHFIMGGYDPFSFTTEEISNVDKMNFIHGNL